MRLVVSIGLLAGCGPAVKSACVREFPASDGYGFVGDGWHYECPDDDPDCAPALPTIEGRCASDGHPCQGEITVTYEAARCIAERMGMKEGQIGLQADLMYDSFYERPTWWVSNQLRETGGNTNHIDARDGGVLLPTVWELTVD